RRSASKEKTWMRSLTIAECASVYGFAQSINRFADGQIQDLAVEGGVIAGSAAKAHNFSVGQLVLTSTLHRTHDFRSTNVDDVQRHLGIGSLCLATAQHTKQLPVSGFFAAKLCHIA